MRSSRASVKKVAGGPCSNKKIERDDDSKKSHPALADFVERIDRYCRFGSPAPVFVPASWAFTTLMVAFIG